MDYAAKISSLTGARIAEPEARISPKVLESEIQARWYSGECGSHFRAMDGNTVSILDFGKWNHEAGPDFKDCEVQIGTENFCGDIEIDMDAKNWERHGHAESARFNNVVLHVFLTLPAATFFTRTESHRNVTQVRLYTRDGRGHRNTGRTSEAVSAMTEWEDEEVVRFLEAAARYRLDAKGRSLGKMISVHGEKEALFQAIAVALGYKHNQIPCQLLAQRTGLERILQNSGEALLFGLAGFLDGADFHLYEDRSREYQRRLWDEWWAMRSSHERLILNAQAWNLSGCRPANHPHRRVAALAAIGKRFDAIFKTFHEGDEEKCIREFRALHHPFWEGNWSLAADALPRRMALLGEQRINEILTNIFFPYHLSRGEEGWVAFCKRNEDPYRQLREDVTLLFGHRPAILRMLRRCVIQQGVLQVIRDIGRKKGF